MSDPITVTVDPAPVIAVTVEPPPAVNVEVSGSNPISVSVVEEHINVTPQAASPIQVTVVSGPAGPAGPSLFPFGISIDNDGDDIPAETYGDTIVPIACTIQNWWLVANAVGDIEVEVWKDTLGNFPPTVDDLILTASLSSAQTGSATGLSVAIAEGDVLRFNVKSCSGISTIQLRLLGGTA